METNHTPFSELEIRHASVDAEYIFKKVFHKHMKGGDFESFRVQYRTLCFEVVIPTMAILLLDERKTAREKKNLAALVTEMRQAQKNYFHTRSKKWLERSKQLES